jgi:hypothetical protein
VWPLRAVDVLAAVAHVFVVTVNAELLDIEPTLAETVVEPIATPVTRPPVTVAIVESCTAHAALFVTSAVLPSE